MKKILKGSLLILLGAVIALGTVMFIGENESLEVYLEETIIPNAVLALTTVGGIAGMALPIIGRTDQTLLNFKAATKDVSITAEEGRALKESFEDYKKELLTEMKTELERSREALLGASDALTALRTELLTEEKLIEENEEIIKKVLLIGFTNSRDLVANGSARLIAKEIEKDEEN